MDNRYSPGAIATSSDRERPIQELAREVEQRVQPHIDAAMRDIVSELNALGHRLVEEEPDATGGICFESEPGAPGLYLYLCHDNTVSAGVRD